MEIECDHHWTLGASAVIRKDSRTNDALVRPTVRTSVAAVNEASDVESTNDSTKRTPVEQRTKAILAADLADVLLGVAIGLPKLHCISKVGTTASTPRHVLQPAYRLETPREIICGKTISLEQEVWS